MRVRTRTALALISKHWRTLSSEILFEYLQPAPSTLKTFFRVIKDDWTMIQQRSLDGDTSTRLYIGRFVKHIHVTFPDPSSADYIPLEYVNDEFLPLFRRFTNPELLSIDIGGPGAEWVDTAMLIMANVASNGYHLHSVVGTTDFAIFPLLWTPQIGTIEVMELWGGPGMGNFWDDIPPVTFPRLNTLSLSTSEESIGSLFRWFSRCGLPSLTRFISGNLGSVWDNVAPFFVVHGKSFVALDVPNPGQVSLSLLLPCCPSLQEATIIASELDELIPAIPKLIYIGMGYWLYTPSYSRDLSLQSINAWNERMKDIFAHRTRGILAVIRLLQFGPGQVSVFRKCGPEAVQLLEHWIQVCKADGVRLEFEGGELVEIPKGVDDGDGRQPGDP
jgi:hypothetical protein